MHMHTCMFVRSDLSANLCVRLGLCIQCECLSAILCIEWVCECLSLSWLVSVYVPECICQWCICLYACVWVPLHLIYVCVYACVCAYFNCVCICQLVKMCAIPVFCAPVYVLCDFCVYFGDNEPDHKYQIWQCLIVFVTNCIRFA